MKTGFVVLHMLYWNFAQSQLATFRIRELKDVLSRLGLPKQGKKQVLVLAYPATDMKRLRNIYCGAVMIFTCRQGHSGILWGFSSFLFILPLPQALSTLSIDISVSILNNSQ